jgi:ArsR family transcriptional regulator, arsenate/arsenite/antimonite-responsive transcriptional repressor
MPMTIDVEMAPTVMLKAVAEPLRWRILELLAAEELCVCHLVEALDARQPLVSHHLGVLRAAGLVESDRHRYWTYYRLCPDALAALGRSVIAVAEHAPAAGHRRRPCC